MIKLNQIIKRVVDQQILSLRFDPRRYWNKRAKERSFHAVMQKPERDKVEQDKMSELLDEFPDVGSVLDFGCGVGRFFPLLKSKFKDVWATDFSSEMLKRARESNGRGISFCEVNDLKPVDMIFCFTVLVHILSNQEWGNTLKTLIQTTKKYLFICDAFKGKHLILGRHNKVRNLESYLNKIDQIQWCKYYPEYINGLDVLIICKKKSS